MPFPDFQRYPTPNHVYRPTSIADRTLSLPIKLRYTSNFPSLASKSTSNAGRVIV
jgi:hypothetical protein